MKDSLRQQNPIQGFLLTFFTRQDHRHRHQSLAHWLVEEARAMRIGGATLISATEGFGHRQHLHRVHLIDLSEQPLEVVMAVTADEADRLFAKLASEKIKVVYSKSPVEFGTVGSLGGEEK